MRNFAYSKVSSANEALTALDGHGQRQLIAGGTDLLSLMKSEIVSPDALVDISAWQEGVGIEARDDGLHIGALTPLSHLAAHDTIQASYKVLSDACGLAASPQLRNMGTLGGNMLQQTRCWYYRGPHDCWLKGGDTCFARDGENQHHAIFLNQPQISPCVSAHPSDPAVALLALGARVKLISPEGAREIAIEEWFALPEENRRNFVALPPNSVITEFVLPLPPHSTRSIYLKAMERAAWGFALAGVAIYVESEGGIIRTARVALSGVAPIPMRAKEVEARLMGASTRNIDGEQLAEALVEGANPLSQNRYKIALLRGLFSEALAGVLA